MVVKGLVKFREILFIYLFSSSSEDFFFVVFFFCFTELKEEKGREEDCEVEGRGRERERKTPV